MENQYKPVDVDKNNACFSGIIRKDVKEQLTPNGTERKVLTVEERDRLYKAFEEILFVVTGKGFAMVYGCNHACGEQGCKKEDCLTDMLNDDLVEVLNNYCKIR